MSAFTFFQLLGGSLGIAVEGSLLNHYVIDGFMSGMHPTQAILKALNKVFLVTVAPGACVFIFSWFVKDVPKSANSTHAIAL